MKTIVSVLALVGKFTENVGGVSVKSDTANNDQDEIRSLTDLDIQDVEDVSLEASDIEETKIKAVMEQTYCSKQKAINALLTHDEHIDDAVAFIKGDMEETQSDASSSVPIRVKPLPSGRVWGQETEVGSVSFREDSSQIGGGDPSSSNLGEAVVITATEGFPANINLFPVENDQTSPLGIFFDGDQDDLTFEFFQEHGVWLNQHTNLRHYQFKRYCFVKVNSTQVKNIEDFTQALKSLTAGDPLAFTLRKKLYSLGEGVGELFVACASGEAGLVRKILESDDDIDVNRVLEGGLDDLHKRTGLPVNQIFLIQGYTPLMLSCHLGHTSVVEELLRNPRIQVNKDGPLGIACGKEKGSSSEIVRLLLGHSEIDVNQNGGGGALWEASRLGHLDIVKQLIEHKDIDVNATPYDQTPLSVASERGHSEIVKCLLTKPDIDTSNKDPFENKTAMEYATDKGHANIVQMLLEHETKNSK